MGDFEQTFQCKWPRKRQDENIENAKSHVTDFVTQTSNEVSGQSIYVCSISM